MRNVLLSFSYLENVSHEKQTVNRTRSVTLYRPVIFLLFLLLAVFCLPSKSSAQVITEGFEEAVWNNVASTSTAATTSTGINVTSYSTTGTASTYGTGSWLYSAGYRVTASAGSSSTYTTHSGANAFHLLSSSSAYLITPLIPNGVTSVTLWLQTRSSTGAINIYAATNATITTNAASASSSNTAAAGWYMSSGYTVPSTQSMTSVSFQVTGAASSNPAFIKIQRSSSDMTIDDIVITTALPFTSPTTQASNINNPTPAAPTSMPIGWTRGDGSNVAVFIRPTSEGSITAPADGSTNTANTVYAGSGQQCIYNGTGTSVTVTGLTPSTSYTVQAFEYNGTGSSSKFLTTSATNNPANLSTTAAVPTLTAIPNPLAFGGVKTNTVSDKSYTLSGDFLTGAPGNITVTAPAGYLVSLTSGSGFGSSVNVPYASATLSATTIYVRFAPTAQTAYNDNVTNVGGGASTNLAVTGAGSLYNVGDYMAKASGNWGVAATWNKWDGSAWVASSDFPNATTVDVYITGGFTVTDETSARSVNNVFITGNSTLLATSTTATTTSPLYLKIYGSTFSVESGSTVGVTSNTNIYDNISLDVFSTNLTITGNGGVINFSRMRPNSGNTTITIDNDVTIHYHGSTHGGNATGFFIQAGDNNTLTVNAGKTLTFAPWSCLAISSSSHTSGTLALTVNVNGTMTFIDGPVPGNAAANGWAGHTNGYLSMGISGKLFNLNIGSTGTVNVSELYPNGTKADNSPGAGDVTTINVATGGALNVSKIADFRKATQTVTGGGAFNLATGAILHIGSTDGITASSAFGNIQTTTRNYVAKGSYFYDGTAAQTTGDGLPSIVDGFTINNATGVTLTNNLTVGDSLVLTNGLVTTGAKSLTIVDTATYKGGADTSYVNGSLTRLTSNALTLTFPVGKGGSYRPFSVIPNSTTASSYSGEYFNIAGAAGSSCVTSPVEAYTKNEYWTISKNSGSDAQVLLNFVQTKSTGQWTSDGTNTVSDPSSNKSIVVAHYNGTCWENAGGTLSGSSTSGGVTSNVLSSFSPFTFGYVTAAPLPIYFTSITAKQVGTGIELNFTNATEANIVSYEIERSADAVHFSTVATVSPRRNNGSSISYQSLDAVPFNGVNYYRIKATDVYGKSFYSAIAKVNTKATDVEFTVYPNPVKGSLLTLQLSNLSKGIYTLKLINNVGQVVSTQTINHSGGSASQSFELGKVASGLYQLQLTGNGFMQTQQVIKQ